MGKGINHIDNSGSGTEGLKTRMAQMLDVKIQAIINKIGPHITNGYVSPDLMDRLNELKDKIERWIEEKDFSAVDMENIFGEFKSLVDNLRKGSPEKMIDMSTGLSFDVILGQYENYEDFEECVRRELGRKIEEQRIERASHDIINGIILPGALPGGDIDKAIGRVLKRLDATGITDLTLDMDTWDYLQYLGEKYVLETLEMSSEEIIASGVVPENLKQIILAAREDIAGIDIELDPPDIGEDMDGPEKSGKFRPVLAVSNKSPVNRNPDKPNPGKTNLRILK